MLSDYISTRNYGQYNIKVMERLGLNIAVYVNTVLGLQDYEMEYSGESGVKQNGFVIDREFVRKRTSFNSQQQMEIERKLNELNIIKYFSSDKTTIYIDTVYLMALMNSEDVQTLAKVKDVSLLTKSELKEQNRKAKQEGMAQTFKAKIVEQDEQLKNTYYMWIDQAIQNPKCKFNSEVVMKVQDFINANITSTTASGQQVRDIKKAEQILRIAIENNYCNDTAMQWALDKYNNNWYNKKKSYSYNLNNQTSFDGQAYQVSGETVQQSCSIALEKGIKL